MWTRRQFLKAGIAGGALLVAVRAAYGPLSPDPLAPEDAGFTYDVLSAKERTVLASVAPVMLAGALPADPAERERAVVEVIRGVDRAVSGLPPSVQGEVAQLFALLGFPLTRRLLAGVGESVARSQSRIGPALPGALARQLLCTAAQCLRSAARIDHGRLVRQSGGLAGHRLSRSAGSRHELKLRTTALNRRGAEAQRIMLRHACARGCHPMPDQIPIRTNGIFFSSASSSAPLRLCG